MKFVFPLMALLLAPNCLGAKLPSAEEILTRFTSAVLVRSSLDAHRSLRMTGRIVSPAQSFEGSIEILKAKPNKKLAIVRIDGYGRRLIGFDGTNGWQLELTEEPSPIEGAELLALREDSHFNQFDYDPDDFREMRVLDRVAFEGESCDRLLLVLRSGSEWFEYFSVETGLLIARMRPGKNGVTEVFSDYKGFGGIKLPTRIETKRKGVLEQSITISAVEFDSVASDAFQASRYEVKWRADAVPAQSKSSPGPLDDVDNYVLPRLKELGIPGLSLVVIKKGKVIKSAGYGFANLESKIPATRETIYEIGSMTKCFTATVVMQLAEEGKLKLDDSIDGWIDHCPTGWKGITVRHLLTHTSGLRHAVIWGTAFRQIPDGEFFTRAEKLSLKFEPSENWSYSNIGYQLLGLIIQKVSSNRWNEVLSNRIFQPLAMRSTARLDPQSTSSRRARGYALGEDGRLIPGLFDPWATAASGVQSTVEDLARWDAALDRDDILKQEILQQMWQPAALRRGTVSWYGTGWFLDEYRGRQVIYHGGDTASGFCSTLMRFPDEKLTIILLMNRVGIDKTELAKGVADYFLGLDE